MTELSRGGNAGLASNSGPVEVAVSGARRGSVDLMVFQLAVDRKVRSDADFIFFNQPTSPEGAVRLLGADRITLDLNAVPSAVETLAVAVAMDDAATGSLNAIPGLAVTVRSGADQHRADASGLTTERAAVLVEVYRRAGAWKVRNVSAGWSAGLPALAREHGVTVDEAPQASAPTPTAASAAAAYPSPGTGAYPTTSTSDYLPPPVVPSRVPAASTGYPTAGHPAVPGPPPGNYPAPGGWAPPGGSLPPSGQQGPQVVAGWPPPGGNLRPVNLPPPAATPGGWPPPGGSVR